jgi:hypothetical protein
MREPRQPHASQTRRRMLKSLAASTCALTVPASIAAAKDTRVAQASMPATPKQIIGKGYRLVQNWDFGSTVTDLTAMREAFFTRLIYEGGKLASLRDEWQRYSDNENHVFEDGALALVARAPHGVAQGKWYGKYGYFQCRMKVPGGLGIWPAFWLIPQNQKWPPEIDVVEIVNNGRDTTRHSFHYVHRAIQTDNATYGSLLDHHKRYVPGFDYQDDYHTFAVEWTGDRVKHYVDDVLVADRQFRWVLKDGSDAGPAHLVVNLAIGGSWPGPPTAETFPAKLLVRYIRVWQR